MITGYLSPRLEPLIPLTVRNNQGQSWTTEAVIDTGFNDFLSINPEIISALNLEPVGSLTVELADGTVRDVNYYPLYIEWLGADRFIMAQEGSGPPLVGMILLLDCELNITVQYQAAVTIKPIT